MSVIFQSKSDKVEYGVNIRSGVWRIPKLYKLFLVVVNSFMSAHAQFVVIDQESNFGTQIFMNEIPY